MLKRSKRPEFKNAKIVFKVTENAKTFSVCHKTQTCQVTSISDEYVLRFLFADRHTRTR